MKRGSAHASTAPAPSLQAEGEDRFVLVDAFSRIPWSYFPPESLPPTIDALGKMVLSRDVPLQLNALRALEQLRLHRLETEDAIVHAVRQLNVSPGPHSQVLDCMRRRVLGLRMNQISSGEVSDFYLSNLKNAVHWTIKLVQIDLLCNDVRRHPDSAFHTAMHLSNLLSVSEHLPVREYAGQRLLEVCQALTISQRNEIAIDLIRELESGQDQISRFIPPYAGNIICMLPEKELLEAVDLLEAAAPWWISAARSNSSVYPRRSPERSAKQPCHRAADPWYRDDRRKPL